jgi:hypothetical protein
LSADEYSQWLAVHTANSSAFEATDSGTVQFTDSAAELISFDAAVGTTLRCAVDATLCDSQRCTDYAA